MTDIIGSKMLFYRTRERTPLKLGTSESEFLFLLSSSSGLPKKALAKLTRKSMKNTRKILNRLKSKRLVEKTANGWSVTGIGDFIIRALSTIKPKSETFRRDYVFFDLDDTLVPSIVDRNADFNYVKKMKDILIELRKRGVKIGVISVNDQDIVFKTLLDNNLLHLIDIPPIGTYSKGKELKNFISKYDIPPERIMFIGHDLNSDLFNIKKEVPGVKVGLFKDSVSQFDMKVEPPENLGILYLRRDIRDIFKALKGETKDYSTKDKLKSELELPSFFPFIESKLQRL